MGNVLSRCAQNLRHALRTCSKKHPEDEAMLSTCDSEPPDKCQEPLYGPAVNSRAGSRSSLVRHQDKMEAVHCRSASSTPKPRLKLCPHHHSRQVKDGYSTLSCSDTESLHRAKTHADKESQTYSEDFIGLEATSPASILSKEYIVRTYSIQNATPSPATQAKFSPQQYNAQTRKGSSSSSSQSTTSYNSPIVNLEKRHDDVLQRLEQLQSSVSQLADKYKVSETPVIQAKVSTSATKPPQSSIPPPAAKVNAGSKPMLTSSSVLDLVINIDPSSIPLSLIILSEQLSAQYKVLKSTYSHSSVTGLVPEKLFKLFPSNGLKRSECQIAINLVWKKVACGPELLVDPTRQTAIQGEVNVARYLARLLNPSLDQGDVVKATQQDDLLDIAQLQILEGNSKEKLAAVRSLNSLLGKSTWLSGNEPSTADICCWSALHQSGQVASPPANVKKWLTQCGQHKYFEPALVLVS